MNDHDLCRVEPFCLVCRQLISAARAVQPVRLCEACEEDARGYLQSFSEAEPLDVIEERTARWLRMVKQAVTQ